MNQIGNVETIGGNGWPYVRMEDRQLTGVTSRTYDAEDVQTISGESIGGACTLAGCRTLLGAL